MTQPPPEQPRAGFGMGQDGYSADMGRAALHGNGGAYPIPIAGSMRLHQPTPWYSRRLVHVLLGIAGVAIIVLGAAVMLLVLTENLGIGVLLLAASVAILPVPFLLLALMWLDRYEPEPAHYLVFSFFWGAFVATAVALLVNSVGIEIFAGPSSNRATKLTAIFVAPPAEEIAKALPLFIFLVLAALGRRPINGVIDGIVYAGMSAVGFAFVENILYFGQAYLLGKANNHGNGLSGLFALFGTFILRGVMSPFAHPLFTCMTGIGVGIAVRHRSRVVRVVAPLLGLSLAISLHSFWNLLATSGNLLWLAGGYVGLMVPLFVALVVVAVWMRSREAKLVGQILPPYVAAGWLSRNELVSMSTLGGRRAARTWAGVFGGQQATKAMQDFQLAATKLALLRESALNGRRPLDYQETELSLLSTMASCRHVFSVHAAAATQRWLRHRAPPSRPELTP